VAESPWFPGHLGAQLFGFFVQTSVITGGTGDYAGATGRLGYVGSEDEGFFRGWICKNK
jgi:hypothetical protein